MTIPPNPGRPAYDPPLLAPPTDSDWLLTEPVRGSHGVAAMRVRPAFGSVFWPVLAALLVSALVLVGVGLLILGQLTSGAWTPPADSSTPTVTAPADDGNPLNDWQLNQ